MTNNIYHLLIEETANYTDIDAYVSDLALSSIWGDGDADIDSGIMAERVSQLQAIYTAAHRSVKDIARESGMSVRQIALHFGIPQRTVENWSAGTREAPLYVLMMIQELLGLICIDRK